MSVVLLPWVVKMSWKCQSILQGGFRGPDIANVPNVKKVNRWLRTVSQENADPAKDYMRNDGLPTDLELCEELEFTTCHYTHHLADALMCVGIYHPDGDTRDRAYWYHYRIAEELFHFVPESKETFHHRHRDITKHA